MYTTSQVKAGLDDLASEIKALQIARIDDHRDVKAHADQIAGLPTKYADLLAAVDAYTPTGVVEEMAQAEKAKFVDEFLTLKGDMDTAVAALAE